MVRILRCAQSHAELGAPGAYSEAVDRFLGSLGLPTSWTPPRQGDVDFSLF